MRAFRLFISSPGDASIERRRTDIVIRRLNGEFAGLARLDPIRWENEHYRAHATFQAQIPPAAECDIVLGILRWRLGMVLPPDFERLSSGEPYPSGTAYELLTAIEKRKAGAELPDVFVFRYSGSAPPVLIGEQQEEAKRRDWAALRGFFERWFLSTNGHFLAALNSYASEDDFEAQAEALLRKWLAEKVSGAGTTIWPATKGSPFRGLGVFGARHTPVFFGRSSDIRRALDLWCDAAARGTRFLLVVGGSGTGKSSLVRAGLIPRLVTPGVVREVDLWRVAVMRPGDSPSGPIDALASALLRHESDLPLEEEGRGPSLPEIAEGDSKTPTDLAAVLIHADTVAERSIVNALARIEERVKATNGYDREVRCDLVLFIDQLEELFAPSMVNETRTRFLTLLGVLVKTGRIWLAATLRADLYAKMLELPALKTLKDSGACYDLSPPGSAELAEIVRAPASAAGLTFETDPVTNERLDEVLLSEADQPDMLPLVQLALSQLWEARESRSGEMTLPLAAFRRSGGVKGIIEDAGEAAIVGIDAAVLLPPLIRRLGEVSGGCDSGFVTARAVPLLNATPDQGSEALVNALIQARLLTISDEGGVTILRLAHQRVLRDGQEQLRSPQIAPISIACAAKSRRNVIVGKVRTVVAICCLGEACPSPRHEPWSRHMGRSYRTTRLLLWLRHAAGLIGRSLLRGAQQLCSGSLPWGRSWQAKWHTTSVLLPRHSVRKQSVRSRRRSEALMLRWTPLMD